MVNEQKILQIYSDDPQRGFKLLMDCYQEPVYYYVRRQLVSHDDAEDVTQEVFIRIFRGLDGFIRLPPARCCAGWRSGRRWSWCRPRRCRKNWWGS